TLALRFIFFLPARRQKASGGFQFLALVSVDLRIGKIQAFEGVDNRTTHDEAGVPLVIRRNDEPGCIWGRRMANHLLIRFHVVIPVCALLYIRSRELPVFVGLIEPGQKAALLLFLRKIEKEFKDDKTVAVEMLLQ